jgi:NAD(P)-dependent dehydrogenase (short-subunit alcohol dehydrogenase family)
MCRKRSLVHVDRGGGGSIVHITSVAAFAGQELVHPYIARRRRRRYVLTQTMARTGAPYGIRVNAIAPGDIYTPANGGDVGPIAALLAIFAYTSRSDGAAPGRRLAAQWRSSRPTTLPSSRAPRVG